MTKLSRNAVVKQNHDPTQLFGLLMMLDDVPLIKVHSGVSFLVHGLIVVMSKKHTLAHTQVAFSWIMLGNKRPPGTSPPKYPPHD